MNVCHTEGQQLVFVFLFVFAFVFVFVFVFVCHKLPSFTFPCSAHLKKYEKKSTIYYLL